ncbi:26637_t:CDS:2 [Dentiscutata erythropus]|uniref:26637_t:CDS:1 n=1 Tax=Dentiscutata erythropus TaxID=1348616 RepID=A0A9N9BZG3_9GLOM|nr:26637_t:CDS:2 [Dentiscutata erythropus]
MPQLSLNKKLKITWYSAEKANNEFSFVDINFCLKINQDETNQQIHTEVQSQVKKIIFTFCLSEHCNHILNLIAKHFNQHPFISAFDKQYYSPNQICEAVVREIYIYCKNNNLK